MVTMRNIDYVLDYCEGLGRQIVLSGADVPVDFELKAKPMEQSPLLVDASEFYDLTAIGQYMSTVNKQ